MTDYQGCERCGHDLEKLDVTTFGSAERAYVSGMACDCPGPRCFACTKRLDRRGRCENIDCYMLNNIVPIPEVA